MKTDVFKFSGSPTVHVRIDFACFEARMKAIEHHRSANAKHIDLPLGSTGSHMSDRSDTLGQIQTLPRIESLTESTTEISCRKKTLNPFQEKGTFISLPPSDRPPPPADPPPSESTELLSGFAENAEDDEEPGAVNAPAESQNGRRTPSPRDWRAKVAAEIPVEATSLFDGLFPDYPACLTSNADAARKFYKAWTRGALSLPGLRLLGRFWATAAQRDGLWRQSHPSSFLGGGKLVCLAIGSVPGRTADRD